MKLPKIIFTSVLLLTVVYGCSLFGGGHHHSNTFSYTARDTLGAVVAEGWLTLDLRDSSNVSGEWEINQVKDSVVIGPQVGHGNLKGSLKSSNDLWVGLNPNWVDNNVFLSGKYDGDTFTGKWTYSSFIGLTNWGTFKAIRR